MRLDLQTIALICHGRDLKEGNANVFIMILKSSKYTLIY